VHVRRADVLHRVDDRLAPRKRPGLAVADLGRLTIDGDSRVLAGQVDTQPVRMTVSWLDAPRRNAHLQHAHEHVLERDLVTVWRHFHGIQRVTALVKSNGHLRVYDGSTMQRDLDLGPAAMLHIDAVKNNGQFVVSKSDFSCQQRVAMLVDPERGVLAQAPGLMAIQPHTTGAAVSAGREIEPLFADATGAHYTWNPATGERKRVF